MKKTVKAVLSWVMALLLFFSTAMTNPITARAEGSKSVTLKISCASGMTVPESYQINYEIVDSTGQDNGPQQINGNADGSEASETVSVPEGGKLRIFVASAGNDIFYNGAADNSWVNKEIEYDDLATEYSFQLQPGQNPGGAGESGGSTPSPSTTIEFSGAAISSGTATYVVGETSVNVAVSVDSVAANIENNNGHNELTVENSKFEATVFTFTGFDPETMKVVIRGSDNYSQELTVTGNSASLSGLHFPGNMVNFSVEAKTQSDPGNSPGGEGDNGGQGGSNTEETINLTVTWTGDFGEIKVGGHSANLGNNQETFSSARVNSEGKIEVVIQAPFAEDFNSIKLNGQENFTGAKPEGKYIFYIPKTDTSLSIAVTKAEATKGTIVWAYDDSFGADAKVENGTVEMVSEFDGAPGHYLVDYDAEVTIRLIPAYGYQVVGAMINGDVPLTANSATNEFKFTMPHTNVHFQGIFTKTEDIVANSASAVSNASFAGDKIATSGGTAKMTLTDATPSDTSAITVAIDSSKEIQAVDISMDQLFYKNSASDVWSTNKSELSSAAQVNLSVNQDAVDYAVLREHNGVVTEIPASYNHQTHTISFSSDKYSTYTLVPLAEESNDGGNEGESGNVESEPNTPVETPSVSAPLSTETIGGKEINSWGDLEEVLVAEAESATKTEGEKELIKLTISPSNAIVPTNIFKAVAKTEENGIHLFAGSGTALTFINDSKLSSQEAIDLSCTTTESETGRTIKFKGTGKLSATSVLHSVAPIGVKKVTIYLTDAPGNKKKIFETSPTDEGRFCFEIKELGEYIIEYK